MSKALAGIRILDMTHVQAGPSASQLLAWMGADVIKLEPPQGDITRGQLRDIPDVDSLYFGTLNCNKRSITVNMKTDEGKSLFADLLTKCDVLMENFGPGVLDRFGFTWERVHAINPMLIMASIKGFGSTGPYADFKAYENVAQAMGGAMATTGFNDGPPCVSGAQVGDSGTGLHFVIGILAAIHHRVQYGEGQYVEVAMMDSVLNLIRMKMRDHERLQKGPLPEYSVSTDDCLSVPRSGNDSGGGQLGNVLWCARGGSEEYLYVVVQEPIWPALAKLVGGEHLLADPRFITIDSRRKNQQAMWAILNGFAAQYTKSELMTVLNKIDVPCGPVLSTAELAKNEHLHLREMYIEVDHAQRGKYWTVGMPIKLSASPAVITPAPLLGEHTVEILHEVLGYDQTRIAKLRDAKAI